MLKTRAGVWGLVFLVALGCAFPACAEEQPDAGSSDGSWSLRLTAHLGPSYLSYEEELSQPDVETDFQTVAFTFNLKVEANLLGLSPFLGVQTSVASGIEDVNSRDATGLRQEQEQNLDVTTLLFDAGLGYRIDLGIVTLVPAVAYTFRLMDFERSDFEFNGVDVLIVDLDGAFKDEVDELITANGVTGSLRVEIEVVEFLEIYLRFAYTYLDEPKVVNTLGGTVRSDEGYLIRGGGGVVGWFNDSFGIGANLEVLYQDLDKSDVEIQTGAVGIASVQFPNSTTVNGAITFGVHLRF